jgi:hypothetical protein
METLYAGLEAANAKEQAMIERRRRAEEERKKRIFDPKATVKGVCKYIYIFTNLLNNK